MNLPAEPLPLLIWLRQFFGIANRRVQVVIERFVIEQASDRAFAVANILDDFVNLIRQLAQFLGQLGAGGGQVAHRAAGG